MRAKTSRIAAECRRLSVAAVGGGVGTVLFVVVALMLGADPKDLLRVVQNNPNVGAQQPAPQGAPGGQGIDDEGKKFVKVVLAETEDVWTELFQEQGQDLPQTHTRSV